MDRLKESQNFKVRIENGLRRLIDLENEKNPKIDIDSIEFLDDLSDSVNDLMIQAENDLQEYLDKWEEDNYEINIEAPLYFIELKECKTVKEIKEYMEQYGWEKSQ